MVELQELNTTTTLRELPNNLQAEQLLLGAILSDNEILVKINDFLLPLHFYHPAHQKIFQQINHFYDKAIIATAVTLKNSFENDPLLADLGGNQYLAELAHLGLTCFNPVDHAKTIHDLALRREIISLSKNMLDRAFSHDLPLDGVQQIEQAEQSLFNLASQGQSETGFRPLVTSLALAIEHTNKAYKNRDKLTGISTGFLDVDNYLNGFQNSDLVILAARPSMGKTALAVNFAVNACEFLKKQHVPEENKKPPAVGFFSLEMSAEQLALRILAMVSEISSSKIRNGDLSDTDFKKIVEANRTLQDYPLFIDDTPALSISAVRTRARRLKRQHNLQILFIDYLQLVRGSTKGVEGNRVQEISEITQGLKAIAKELNIPVIALSQLSRAVEQREDKRPQLADLRESGSIEQDADIVMFIYREEYYLLRKKPREDSEKHARWASEMESIKNTTEIIIAKHRNGPIGTPKLYFDSMTTKFGNYVENNKAYPL